MFSVMSPASLVLELGEELDVGMSRCALHEDMLQPSSEFAVKALRGEVQLGALPLGRLGGVEEEMRMPERGKLPVLPCFCIFNVDRSLGHLWVSSVEKTQTPFSLNNPHCDQEERTLKELIQRCF